MKKPQKFYAIRYFWHKFWCRWERHWWPIVKIEPLRFAWRCKTNNEIRGFAK